MFHAPKCKQKNVIKTPNIQNLCVGWTLSRQCYRKRKDLKCCQNYVLTPNIGKCRGEKQSESFDRSCSGLGAHLILDSGTPGSTVPCYEFFLYSRGPQNTPNYSKDIIFNIDNFLSPVCFMYAQNWEVSRGAEMTKMVEITVKVWVKGKLKTFPIIPRLDQSILVWLWFDHLTYKL